jgi:hypothetical protein
MHVSSEGYPETCKRGRRRLSDDAALPRRFATPVIPHSLFCSTQKKREPGARPGRLLILNGTRAPSDAAKLRLVTRSAALVELDSVHSNSVAESRYPRSIQANSGFIGVIQTMPVTR